MIRGVLYEKCFEIFIKTLKSRTPVIKDILNKMRNYVVFNEDPFYAFNKVYDLENGVLSIQDTTIISYTCGYDYS
jgi:hypothetical protein